MRYTQGNYPIIRKENLSRNIFSYTICTPEIADLAVPGQFVHIALSGHSLRRPISICEIDKEAHTIRIVFAVKGKGTADLCALNVGSVIDMIGPLGNGFTLLDRSRKVILIGGGIAELGHVISRIFEVQAYKIDHLLNPDAVASYSYNWSFSLWFVIIALILFFLSYVFRYGEALQKESDETL